MRTPRTGAPSRRGCQLVVALGLLASACPRPAPVVLRLGGVEAPALLARLQAASAQRQQAVGLLRLDYLGTDGLFGGEADVALAAPRRLRIELRSFFNQPAGALACDGERYAYLDAASGRQAAGPLDDPTLRALLPLGLDLDSAIAGLLGVLPPLAPGQTRYAEPGRAGRLALWHPQPGGEAWRLELDDAAARLLELEHLDTRGQSLVVLRLGEHRRQVGLPFPWRGEAEVRGRSGTLRWTWQEVELDGPPLPPEAWRLADPAIRSDEEPGLD